MMDDSESKQFDVPRVSIFDMQDEKYIAVFYGEKAENRAAMLIGSLHDAQTGRYDLSVSDDRCAECGEFFASEARFKDVNDKWRCPVCGSDPKED